MNIYTPQVTKDHYTNEKYINHERWMNYWYQLRACRSCGEGDILEIGVGNGIVRDMLRHVGYQVTTLDIDQDLHPTIIGSITDIPLSGSSFDIVLAAEVLEHIRWEEVSQALSELHRVTRRYIVITLPHSGFVFACVWKLPLFSWKRFVWKLPHFWKTHQFNGEHYWEMGKKGYSRRKIQSAIIASGFIIAAEEIYPDDPAHIHYILEKV